MSTVQSDQVVAIRYTNYRGETAVRRIIPMEICYKSTVWHPEPQWVLEAFDIDKDAHRSFALKDVIEWGVAWTTSMGEPE